MKQDALCNKNVDELKNKVLELCDTIDKQNDLIKKYQKALRIAADNMVDSGSCWTCPLASICESKYDETGLTCSEKFVEEWGEKAGIE